MVHKIRQTRHPNGDLVSSLWPIHHTQSRTVMERLPGKEGTPKTFKSLLVFITLKTHNSLWMHVHKTHFVPLSKFIISQNVASYLAASPIPSTFSILILDIRETMQRIFFHWPITHTPTGPIKPDASCTYSILCVCVVNMWGRKMATKHYITEDTGKIPKPSLWSHMEVLCVCMIGMQHSDTWGGLCVWKMWVS